ncbi:hypothetical protein ACFLYE_00075 [Chloroflexota bacterium]
MTSDISQFIEESWDVILEHYSELLNSFSNWKEGTLEQEGSSVSPDTEEAPEDDDEDEIGLEFRAYREAKHWEKGEEEEDAEDKFIQPDQNLLQKPPSDQFIIGPDRSVALEHILSQIDSAISIHDSSQLSLLFSRAEEH